MDVPEEFRGIGLRIEDDVFVNNNMKIEVLTRNCKKEPEELLELLNNES
jgi:Xaa-Pro aminopeptidase